MIRVDNIPFAIKVLGFKGSEVARVLGVTRQRISFIAKGPVVDIVIDEEGPEETEVINAMINNRKMIHVDEEDNKFVIRYVDGVFYIIGKDGNRLKITKVTDSHCNLINNRFHELTRKDLEIIHKYEVDGESEVVNTLKLKGLSKNRASQYMRYLGIG